MMPISHRVGLVVFLTGSVILGQTLPQVFGHDLPQIREVSLIGQILGDARRVMSDSLIQKADEYFHGGVHIEGCTHADHKAAGHTSDAAEEDHNHQKTEAVDTCWHSPWQGINAAVQVQEHRHLETDRSDELVPWFWAAIKLEPKNIQAYLLCADVLGRDLANPDEALRIIEEGIRNNPNCAELELDAGRILLNIKKDIPAATARFEKARAKWKPDQKSYGDAPGQLQLRILFYLCRLAKDRGDTAAILHYHQEALALGVKDGSFVAIERLANEAKLAAP